MSYLRWRGWWAWTQYCSPWSWISQPSPSPLTLTQVDCHSSESVSAFRRPDGKRETMTVGGRETPRWRGQVLLFKVKTCILSKKGTGHTKMHNKLDWFEKISLVHLLLGLRAVSQFHPIQFIHNRCKMSIPYPVTCNQCKARAHTPLRSRIPSMSQTCLHFLCNICLLVKHVLQDGLLLIQVSI